MHKILKNNRKEDMLFDRKTIKRTLIIGKEKILQNGTNTFRNLSISTVERNPQYIKTNKEMQYDFKMI